MALSHNWGEDAQKDRMKKILSKAVIFECACCHGRLPVKTARTKVYRPRSTIMKMNVPKQNVAVYNICEECLRLPEADVQVRVEQYLVSKGLLRNDLKALDVPGHHRGHEHKPTNEIPPSSGIIRP